MDWLFDTLDLIARTVLAALIRLFARRQVSWIDAVDRADRLYDRTWWIAVAIGLALIVGFWLLAR